ncbi:MAG TPA: hypothetical protein PLY70_02450 [Saprospiraceae bacterium]|nr:hypothetical protein [Saprospiraceae bacterium]HPN72194.1 hypothetical protein [Saprospiraceae bacterium]
MTNKQFDDIIKSKMSGLSHDKTSADWDQFSELLKQSKGFSEVGFDEKVAEKVKGHQISYSESHWAILKARLEREEFIRTRLYFSKLAEIAAVFLLLFASTNYAGLKYDFGTEPDPAMFAHLYESSKGEYRNIQKEILKSQQRSSDVVKSVDQNKTAFVSAENQTKSLVEITPTIASAFHQAITPLDVQVPASLQSRNIESIANISDLKIDGMNFASHANGLILEANEAYKPESQVDVIYAAHLNQDTKTRYELKPYMGIGVANTRSPIDEIYKIDATNIYSMQRKAGLAFAAGSGNLKIATGLEWNQNKYQPVQVEEVYGSFREGIKKTSLKDINLHIAKVPIGVKYDFVRNKENSNHSFYVGANVGINAILHSKYNIQETIVPIDDYRNITLNNGNSRSNTTESKLSLKDFSKGILQGGEALTNLFIDTSLELGFEKRISKNANIAISANYSKYLGTQGLGPNEDRYDNLTFNLGVNYLLN